MEITHYTHTRTDTQQLTSTPAQILINPLTPERDHQGGHLESHKDTHMYIDINTHTLMSSNLWVEQYNCGLCVCAAVWGRARSSSSEMDRWSVRLLALRPPHLSRWPHAFENVGLVEETLLQLVLGQGETLLQHRNRLRVWGGWVGVGYNNYKTVIE